MELWLQAGNQLIISGISYSSGAMKTGWLNDGGNWYYLNTSGEMLSNTIVNGYKLGTNGAWVK